MERNKITIQECILNIDMLYRSMQLSYQEIKQFNIPLDSAVYGDMIRYSYIQICIILDEIKLLKGKAEDDIYLRDTFYVIKPVLKAIDTFSGFRKARNIMLAHYNRDRHDCFKPWWKELKDLKLPRTQKEINQIYTWLGIVHSILVSRYYNELMEISLTSKVDVDEYFKWVSEEESKAINNPTPFDHIYDEVEKRINEKGITIYKDLHLS